MVFIPAHPKAPPSTKRARGAFLSLIPSYLKEALEALEGFTGAADGFYLCNWPMSVWKSVFLF